MVDVVNSSCTLAILLNAAAVISERSLHLLINYYFIGFARNYDYPSEIPSNNCQAVPHLLNKKKSDSWIGQKGVVE